ncbi:hypothetical protein EI534_18365 [Pseudomonas frederiksbergensis]|nr:hypothetical protein [Pseudomonas frederiksbergensis]
MIAPAKAGKFTLYGAERQGFAAERATGNDHIPANQTLWRGGLPPLGCEAAPKYPDQPITLWRGSSLPLGCAAAPRNLRPPQNPVARGLVGTPHRPVRLRSSRQTKHRGLPGKTGSQVLGPLRSPTGASSLATGKLPHHKSRSALVRRPSPQPPPNHIQHIAPIAQ